MKCTKCHKTCRSALCYSCRGGSGGTVRFLSHGKKPAVPEGYRPQLTECVYCPNPVSPYHAVCGPCKESRKQYDQGKIAANRAVLLRGWLVGLRARDEYAPPGWEVE
jgi:hypothetical protein